MKSRRRAWLIASVLSLLALRAGAAPTAEGDEQALNADARYAAGLAALKANENTLLLSKVLKKNGRSIACTAP